MRAINIQETRKKEAERRLQMLGKLAEKTLPSDRDFAAQSSRTKIPKHRLKSWHQSNAKEKLLGLYPSWEESDQILLESATAMYEKLNPVADKETLSEEDINLIGKKNEWRLRTTIRWLTRYRVGGLLGLTPKYNPEKRHSTSRRGNHSADLSDSELKKIAKYHDQIEEALAKPNNSRKEVDTLAETIGVSSRSLWRHIQAARLEGIYALARKIRRDRGNHHGLAPAMVELVEDIRLTNPGWSCRAVYDKAREEAVKRDLAAPSKWQVREIIANIPKPVKALADKRENQFRNNYRFTYRMIRGDELRAMYLIDSTLIDTLSLDQRKKKFKKKSGEIRLWLTLAIESFSRVVVAYVITYDRPDKYTIAEAIRQSLLTETDKPFGGVPNEIWVDNGKEYRADHVALLAKELGIDLNYCAPHQPQHKGVVERFFGTLNTRLWSTLPGYVGSNVVERNPTAKATLTPDDFKVKLREFIQQYHLEEHSELKTSPADYWQKHCFVTPVDVHQLDRLLMPSIIREVTKKGIYFEGKIYWHTELSRFVSEKVIVRSTPGYAPPEEIEVFVHDAQGKEQWLCTAFDLESPRGKGVTPNEIRQAQKNQREHIRSRIQKAKDSLRNDNSDSGEESPAPESQNKPAPPPRTPAPAKIRRRNLLNEINKKKGETQ